MTTKVIETRRLNKRYGSRWAVRDCSLHVNEGDIYGFVGRNGAGKSTVMKMLCGLTTPTAGEIKLFGRRVPAHWEGLSTEPRIGVLIEEPGLLSGLSAYENVMAKALALGVPDTKRSCEEVLCQVGLESVGKQKVKGFSLGMKQRLGLALALLGSPEILLLDEPLNGLDPQAARLMRTLLIRLSEEQGTTIFMSSHVLDQLDRVATRFGVIVQGSMVCEMTAEQVQKACTKALRLRTTTPSASLALLQERFSHLSFKADPDGLLRVSGSYDVESLSRFLTECGQVLLELSPVQRDLEDYFVELMGGVGVDELTQREA